MSQASELPGNAAQIEYWNAAAGDTWARLQELLDRQCVFVQGWDRAALH
jgi:hypothetical protein